MVINKTVVMVKRGSEKARLIPPSYAVSSFRFTALPSPFRGSDNLRSQFSAIPLPLRWRENLIIHFIPMDTLRLARIS